MIETTADGAAAATAAPASPLADSAAATPPGPLPPPPACTDCGAPVDGRYCAQCGQSTHVHRTLLHLGEELLHGVMHFDGRIWRTLPLLVFRPGRLTREWVDGRRTRYVSPLALFLFTAFLIFFGMSFGGGRLVGGLDTAPLGDRLEQLRLEVDAERAATREALAALGVAQRAAAAATAGDVEAVQRLRDDEESAQRAFASAAGRLADATEERRTLGLLLAAGPRTDGLEPGSWQAGMRDAVDRGSVRVGVGGDETRRRVLKLLRDPDFALYKLQQTLYKFAFLLVPLSIPFVAVLFAWKRKFTWYDHGVFVLYSLTFMAMLSVVLLLMSAGPAWLGDVAGVIAFVAIPLHMFVQLRGTYALSVPSALWRTAVLLVASGIVLCVFLMLVVLLGFAA